MNKQLLVLRHGKSDWKQNVSDFDRPLNSRGEQASQRMGSWIQQQHLVPDYIICSPAERAKNTVIRLCMAMGLNDNQVHYIQDLYAADLDAVLKALSGCPETTKRVLLVGHNPSFERLLMHLHKSSLQIADDGKLLPTATLAVIAMPDNWCLLEKGCAEVLSITRPAMLPPNIS